MGNTKADYQHFEVIQKRANRLKELVARLEILASAMEHNGAHRLQILHEKGARDGIDAIDNWTMDGKKKYEKVTGLTLDYPDMLKEKKKGRVRPVSD